MSELKWNWAYYPYLDPPEKQAESALKAGYIKVVNKDDVDKVIADLKDKGDRIIFDLKDKLQKESALLKETRECLIESQKMHKRCADNASRIIRRSDRKRCLALAEMCKARYDEEDARVNGHYSSWEYISQEMKYWERWQRCWLALAEEPTWERFLQLIHKEAK